MMALKFLCRDAISPFTGFRWPAPGTWVGAPADRAEVWVHACRPGDLPHWLDDELWQIELEEPVREARYQIASPGGRLVARVTAWEPQVAREYAKACALRARDLALPDLAPALRVAVAAVADLDALAATLGAAGPSSGDAAAFVADAVHNARRVGPATTSYIAATLACVRGGGAVAAFEAERDWQARWLVDRLGLGPVGSRSVH